MKARLACSSVREKDSVATNRVKERQSEKEKSSLSERQKKGEGSSSETNRNQAEADRVSSLRTCF